MFCDDFDYGLFSNTSIDMKLMFLPIGLNSSVGRAFGEYMYTDKALMHVQFLVGAKMPVFSISLFNPTSIATIPDRPLTSIFPPPTLYTCE